MSDTDAPSPRGDGEDDPPSADDPAALRRLAEGYMETDRPAEAVAAYGRLLALVPGDLEALKGRAWAAVAAGVGDTARADAARLQDAFPASADAAATAGELLLALEARDAGLYALDRAVALAGDDPETLYRLARDFQTAAAPEPALALYDRLVDWRPREVLLARAELRREMDDAAGALRDLDGALAAPPGGSDRAYDAVSTARVYLARARAQIALAQWDAAETDARAALDLVPAGALAAEGYVVLATAGFGRGDPAAARAAAEQAVAQDPDNLDAWIRLVSSYTAVDDWSGGLAALHRARAQRPDDERLALNEALLLGEMGDLPGALAAWNGILTTRPDNPTALAMRGTLLRQMNRAGEALGDLNRALRLDPDNRVALQARISMQLHAEDLAGALTDLNRLIALEPRDADLLLLRAGMYLEAGDALAAAAEYTHLLAILPGNAAALSGLGNVQMLAGQYAGALQSYEDAARAAPGDAAGLYNLAAAQAALGRCPQAVELLRRAVAADSRFATDAREDRFLARCRDLPSFAAALRPRPAAGPAAPPRRARGKGRR